MPVSLSPKKPLLSNIVVENDYPEFPNVSSGPDGSSSGSGSPLPLHVEDKYHMDEIIPSKHGNRTIILCFDGTGDQFDEDVRLVFHPFKMNAPKLVSLFQELQYRSVLFHAQEGQQI